jgi:hypothetical protein
MNNAGLKNDCSVDDQRQFTILRKQLIILDEYFVRNMDMKHPVYVYTSLSNRCVLYIRHTVIHRTDPIGGN